MVILRVLWMQHGGFCRRANPKKYNEDDLIQTDVHVAHSELY